MQISATDNIFFKTNKPNNIQNYILRRISFLYHSLFLTIGYCKHIPSITVVYYQTINLKK
jgi:hypothetical protein